MVYFDSLALCYVNREKSLQILGEKISITSFYLVSILK